MDNSNNLTNNGEKTKEYLKPYHIKNSCIYYPIDDNINIQSVSIKEKCFIKKIKDKLLGIRNMIVNKFF